MYVKHFINKIYNLLLILSLRQTQILINLFKNILIIYFQCRAMLNCPRRQPIRKIFSVMVTVKDTCCLVKVKTKVIHLELVCMIKMPKKILEMRR